MYILPISQLHLAGLGCTSYWCSFWVFDSVFLFLTYLSIFVAVLYGGAPSYEFFFYGPSIFIKVSFLLL